ncbi:MAG: hypothetical protein U5L96_10120 [Owenweeksia sp.]|nr:hypothetical protein [Owenweeksia sp.]
MFENLGLVKKFGKDVPLTFSVSYTKMADFNSEYTAMGENRYDSITNMGSTLGEYWLAGAFNLTIPEMEQNGLFEEASATDATCVAGRFHRGLYF